MDGENTCQPASEWYQWVIFAFATLVCVMIVFCYCANVIFTKRVAEDKTYVQAPSGNYVSVPVLTTEQRTAMKRGPSIDEKVNVAYQPNFMEGFIKAVTESKQNLGSQENLHK